MRILIKKYISSEGNYIIFMHQGQDRYVYDQNTPLGKIYNERGVYNAYYKGVDTLTNLPILVSEYKETKYERVILKSKRIKQLQSIQHQNIAKIYDVIVDSEKKNLKVILQWCEGGSLYDYQKSQNTFDLSLTAKIIRDIASALSVIHESKQIHRFVNMENIEFDKDGKTKLTFKCLYPKTIYLSPQEKKGTKTEKNDIFSLGVLMYKLLFSTIPFMGNNFDEELESVRQGVKFPKDEKQNFPLSISSWSKQLITEMTHLQPQRRITSKDITKMIEDNTPGEKKLHLSQEKLKKVLKNNYLPIFKKLCSEKRNIFLAICQERKNIVQIETIKGNYDQLQIYMNGVLEDFSKGMIGFVNIYEKYFVGKDLLVIVSSYQNQGCLRQYLQNGGSLLKMKARSQTIIEELKEKLIKYGKNHSFICKETIMIKKGQYFISYPPFSVEEGLKHMKESDRKMVAPEIREGKKSDNADSWSLGMMKFFLEHEQNPDFDRKGKVIIPSRHQKSIEELDFYDKCIMQNPSQRLHLLKNEPEPEEIQEPYIQPEPKPEPIPAPSPKKKTNAERLSSLRNKVKENQMKTTQNREPKKTCGESISEKLTLFQPLEKHWTKPIRVGLKMLIGLVYLLFLFYFNFFLINGQLIAQHSLYQAKIVHIRAFDEDSTPYINYTLVTKTPSETYDFFYNKTLPVLRDEYKCVLNDYSVNSNVVQIINRSSFTAYQVFGILFSIFNLILFCLKLSKLDFPKVYFITRMEENDFQPIWSWICLNLCMVTQISFIYLLYGSLFHMDLQPCLSKATLTAVQFLLKDWQFSFNIRYSWIYAGLLFSYGLSIFLLIRPQTKMHKGLKIFLVILYLAGAFCRIMGQSGDHIAWQKQSVFGKLGQLLGLIIGITCLIIDILFGCGIAKHQKLQKNNNKVADQSQDEFNITQQNFLSD